MRRDELIKALAGQVADTHVHVVLGDFLLDVEAVDFLAERDAIVLLVPADDLRDAENAGFTFRRAGDAEPTFPVPRYAPSQP